MNLLLDTHAYIWFSTNNRELSSTVKRLIEDSENSSYISIASLWEMSIKISLGKLSIDKDFKYIIQDLTESGINLLPISFDHILMSSALPFHHRDPFDRIIVAQSLCEGMKLLSVDTIFDQYSSDRIW
jgi:PIN domain nuclease of toxin-antitoxin system